MKSKQKMLISAINEWFHKTLETDEYVPGATVVILTQGDIIKESGHCPGS
jgi:hypothetical protein